MIFVGHAKTTATATTTKHNKPDSKATKLECAMQIEMLTYSTHALENNFTFHGALKCVWV